MSNSDFSRGAEKTLASIFAVSGLHLTDSEKRLFREADPFGFILFKRNCASPDQLRALVDSLKESVGRDCPVLIDQEGGRVQRLRPPHWREYKPMRYYGDLFREDEQSALEQLRFETLRLCEELFEVGINVNCAPVLDLALPQTTDAIGDRAFSSDPEIVARLGLSVCRHFIKSGITPVMKHIPGHGRATCDSHHELPRVEIDLVELMQSDFLPFKELSSCELSVDIWGMTAHILYPAIDTDYPVSISKKGIDLIRNTIGFNGILFSDDLDMKALAPYGDIPERAVATLKAGCDFALYCAGETGIMEKIAENVPKTGENTLKRLQKSSKSEKLSA